MCEWKAVNYNVPDTGLKNGSLDPVSIANFHLDTLQFNLLYYIPTLLIVVVQMHLFNVPYEGMYSGLK